MRRILNSIARPLAVVALVLLANGCGIGRVGRLFLAELAFAAVTTAIGHAHIDGSLDQPEGPVSDREFVCVTDEGDPVLVSALGFQAAAARCRHREGRECECRPRAEFARAMRARERTGFADEPWSSHAGDAEAAHRLGRPSPGRIVPTSGSE